MFLTKKDVAAGVVTYNPDMGRLSECLEALCPQVDRVFVYDNASGDERVAELVETLEGVELLPLPDENKGMAKALNALASASCAHDYKAVVFMDQDSVADPSMVEEELVCLRTGVGLVSPLIVDRNERSGRDGENAREAHEVPRAITSGALVDLAAFEAVDGCDERLFVDWVDFELCDNLKDHGFKLVCNPMAILLHEIGQKELAASFIVPTRQGLQRREVYRTNHSESRRFDKARSQAITIAKYGKHTPIGRDESHIFRKEFAKGLLFERRKREFFAATVFGYREGISVAKRTKSENGLAGDGYKPSPWLWEDVQCFDSGDGCDIWRFAIAEGVSSDDLLVRKASGQAVDVEILSVGLVDGRSRCSVRLEKGIDDFDIVHKESVLYRVTPGIKGDLVHHRDCLMVNPGIDEGYYRMSLAERIREGRRRPAEKGSWSPLISIVMPLFQSPPAYLREAIGSVMAQSYGKWELVLVNATPEDEGMRKVLDSFDDRRIREVRLEGNLGIAGNTNRGIAEARGDYIAFMDHDDAIHRDALWEYVLRIVEDPEVDLLYCDEDNFSESLSDRYMPIFKPDLNIDFLLSHNYIVHFLMVSRRVIEGTARSDDAVSGAQDYDLTLKALDFSGRCAHIPRVLYHWRAHEGSTNGGALGAKPYADNACVEVLSRYFSRHGLDPDIRRTDVPYHYRVLHHAKAHDQVTLVLWGRSTDALISLAGQAVSADDGLVSRILILALDAEDGCRQDNLNGVPVTYVGMFPRLRDVVRMAVLKADGTHLVFIDENVVSLSKETVDVLVGYAHVDGVGIVAPKAFGVDGLTYHAGLVFEDGKATFLNRGFGSSMGGGYLGMAECSCAYDAVFASCFAVGRETLEGAERALSEGFGPQATMVQLCLALRDLGKRCVVIPDEPVVYRGSFDDASLDAKELVALAELDECALQGGVLDNPHVECSSGYPRLSRAPLDQRLARYLSLASHRARKAKRMVGRRFGR